MDLIVLSLATLLILMGFFLGLHVAVTLGTLSLLLLHLFGDRPMWEIIGLLAWNTNTSSVLVAVPLFVMLGEIVLRSGISEKLYRVLGQWFAPLPGGLLHSNIAACATFAAVSGSSVATAATIGSVALPAFRARGYDERLVLGSLAAGGTLGILIPPSITMIVYGMLMEVSVGRLYMAGVIPGVLLTAAFMLVIYLFAKVRPGVAPQEPSTPLKTKLIGLIEIAPVFGLMFLVLGTIYLGVATPTEAAAFGLAGATAMACWSGRLSLKMLKETLLVSASTTAMIMLILTASFILNATLAVLGVPYAISQRVAALGLTPFGIMVGVVILYVVLGSVMDGFAMIVTTTPVILPILKTANVDLLWFGVIAVILTEAALISPPEGLNLYVIHGLRKNGEAEEGHRRTIMDVYLGVLPFFLAMLAMIGLIMVFPQIALWLPTTMKGS